MINKRIKRDFFLGSPEMVAQKLLGKLIVKGEISGIISETEAYSGEDDPASHASKGKTSRNFPMFEVGGFSYVYLIYGIRYCFNITTGNIGTPGAVLIRSLIPYDGVDKMKNNRKMNGEKGLANGPGKFSQAFGIDKSFNLIDVTEENSSIEIYEYRPNEKLSISASQRIGIQKGKEKEWRFFLQN